MARQFTLFKCANQSRLCGNENLVEDSLGRVYKSGQ